MARPRVHDDRTGERLLDAAKEILRRDGVSALSVRGVAEAADTSHRAVYAVFGSKQGLVDALAERGYRDLAHRVRAVPRTDDPRADLVAAGVAAFRRFAMDETTLFRLTFEQVSAAVLHQRRVVEAALDSYEALAERVRAVRAIGLVHPDRSDADCIYAFHAVCQGLASCELAAQPPPDGPGLWTGMLDAGLDRIWSDTLAGTVDRFRTVEPPPA